MPSGSKPLSEPMLTQICVAICRYQGTMLRLQMAFMYLCVCSMKTSDFKCNIKNDIFTLISTIVFLKVSALCYQVQLETWIIELKWSGGWSTGTVGWLSASERGHDLEGWPAMNTKCLVPLPFLPDLILWSTENRSHGSPVLVPPETQ